MPVAARSSLEVRVERALGEPQSERPSADEGLEAANPEVELRSYALARREQAGEVAVGGGGGQKLNPSSVPVPDEPGKDVAVVALPRGARARELGLVEGSDGGKVEVAVEAPDLARGQRFETREVPFEASAEERVFEHRREGRGHAHRQGEGDSVAREPIECVEQRQVALDERLVEPAFLEVASVLGVAHEGEVRMQHQREVALSHEWLGTIPLRPRDRGAVRGSDCGHGRQRGPLEVTTHPPSSPASRQSART